jgi:hypothetical protein
MSTPLYKKLGIKSDSKIVVLNLSEKYIDFFSDFPPNVVINDTCSEPDSGFVHIFVQTLPELDTYFKTAKTCLARNGMLWISWPKKASDIISEVDKFKVMKHGLSRGLVDTKIASIDKTWSACKFVYRMKDR